MGDNWMVAPDGDIEFLPLGTPKFIGWENIAQSLAFQCRFNGHVTRFYSVAEHSLRVAKRILMDHEDLSINPLLYLVALLHDAGETIIGDITSPIKRKTFFLNDKGEMVTPVQVEDVWLPTILHYADIQSRDGIYRSKLGVMSAPKEIVDAIVKIADYKMLVSEKRAMIPDCTRPWSIERTHAAYSGEVFWPEESMETIKNRFLTNLCTAIDVMQNGGILCLDDI